MSGGIKEELLDPDYGEVIAIPSAGENILSEEQKANKIRSIVKREFSAEIQKKENTIELIDERLLLAKKTLHRLRYAIVNSYYNSKQFQLTEEDVHKEVTSQKDPVARNKVHTLLKNEQKRIHPALKKLLGAKADLNLDELFKIRPPRKRNKQDVTNFPSTSHHLTIPVDETVESLRTVKSERPDGSPFSAKAAQIKTEGVSDYGTDGGSGNLYRAEEAEGIAAAVKVPRYIEPNNMERDVLKVDLARRNKQKEKFRLIIGNTSKYTPPHSEMDRSTHRWLLYVRGSRDKPDVSHFVQSVTAGLDQSYAPHNVMHLKSSPFHLSRRGWGEFPVQIRLHFKNASLNKPVDIVHHLKLDRNYTGLQTLGAETVVDVWLYRDETMIEKPVEEVSLELPPIQSTSKESTAENLREDKIFDQQTSSASDTEMSWSKLDYKKIGEGMQSEIFDNSIVKTEVDAVEFNETRAEINSSIPIKQESEDAPCHGIKIKTEPMEMDDLNDNFKQNEDFERYNDILNMKFDNRVPQVENEHRKMTHASRSILKLDSKVSVPSNLWQIRKSLLKPSANSLLKPGIANCSQSLIKPSGDSLKSGPMSNAILESIHSDHCYVQEHYLIQGTTLHNLHQRITVDSSGVLIFTPPNKTSLIQGIKQENKLYSTKQTDSTIKESSIPKIIIGLNHQSERAIRMAEGSERAIEMAASIANFINGNLCKVDNVRSAVSLMLRRMPLVHELAVYPDFLKVFPYAVESLERYYELGLTKRRNKEWTRSKFINNILKIHLKNSGSPLWTTKQIVLFSHYHGYYPAKLKHPKEQLLTEKYSGCFNSDDFGNSKAYKEKIALKELFENASVINTLSDMNIFSEKPSTLNEIKQEYETSDNRQSLMDEKQLTVLSNLKLENIENDANNFKRVQTYNILDSSDEEIDVCGPFETRKKQNKKTGSHSMQTNSKMYDNFMPFESEDEKLCCFYIEKICADQGIELRNEHVGNGFTHSLAHKVILSALHSLVEDILRRSLAVKMAAIDAKSSADKNGIGAKVKRRLWRSEDGEVQSVSLRHVFEAIDSRKELDVLTNAAIGTHELHYSGKL